MATSSKVQRGFYLVVQTIKDELINNPNIKTVTFGDITDVDLQKQPLPLSHTHILAIEYITKYPPPRD